jgi:predicted nuclease with RNAse H fold
MNTDRAVWIGADPGGKDNFGLAILQEDGTARTWCVGCADEATKLVQEYAKPGGPDGVGVDAPLWWSSGPSSDRQADQWLRKRYGLSGGQVQTVNSLRGAALAQGMIFVQRMREAFPAVPVTETHPNALLKALKLDAAEFYGRYSVKTDRGTKHEFDAVVSAVAAREGFCGRWRHDLSTNRGPREQDPLTFWLSPINYLWPEV